MQFFKMRGIKELCMKIRSKGEIDNNIQTEEKVNKQSRRDIEEKKTEW